VAIDTGDAKRKMCMDLGAEAFVDFKEVADTTAEVLRITGGGAHAVVVTGGYVGSSCSFFDGLSLDRRTLC
jgi:Zn-dependent alcohol dehydrogenase